MEINIIPTPESTFIKEQCFVIGGEVERIFREYTTTEALHRFSTLQNIASKLGYAVNVTTDRISINATIAESNIKAWFMYQHRLQSYKENKRRVE